MTKWMYIRFSLAGGHSQSKIYNDKKTAAKNTIKFMLKKGYHGYVIKIMFKTIK